jgi:hypothetical protein
MGVGAGDYENHHRRSIGSNGCGLVGPAPIVSERVSGIGFKPPQPTWSQQPAQEQTVSTSAVVRFMRVVGGLLILVALVIGLLWRVKAPVDSL